jgi:OOP family OmpA-OmpF porin
MKKIFTVALVSSLISMPAFAADQGLYVSADMQTYSLTNRGTASNPSAGFRIGGGYHFTPNIAAEVGYVSSGNGTSTSGSSYKVTAMQIAAVGSYPINGDFDVIGKLGVSSNEVDFATCNTCSKSDLMYGIGAQYKINQQFGVRLQYESMGNVTSGTTAVSATNFSIGGIYNF